MDTFTIFNSEIIFTPPYTGLAKVYDAMMATVNYRQWAKYIHSILKKERFKTGALLDIGCGTGQFFHFFKKYRYQMEGCDSSPHMIEIAKHKLPYINFFISQIPQLKNVPDSKYDIIICLFDTINYLWELTDVKKALQKIYLKLNKRGIFIFDIVTEAHCQRYFQNFKEREKTPENISYSRESYFDERNKIQNNYIRIYTAEAIFEELHIQKIYDFDDIKKVVINETSFELKSTFEDFSFDEATKKSGRIQFVLRKTKND
jgi:ubiquinone/menaquinone biosynthesis C-methylase UbiE